MAFCFLRGVVDRGRSGQPPYLFLEDDGSMSRAIMPDFLHLSTRGYEIWAKSIENTLAKMLR